MIHVRTLLGLLILGLGGFSTIAEVSAESFEAPKFGVKTEIPDAWTIALRERDDRVFVALIPQADPDRPGVVACELALAPENLDEYRTRIDANDQRGGRPGTLVRNEVVKTPQGERLETARQFRPAPGVLWHELSVRIIANRQMYTFLLNVDDETLKTARPQFDKLVAATEFSPPNTGADLLDKDKNRWVQREFRFALDLPEGWKPALAPAEIALFYANGQAHGIWADNVLVIGLPPEPLDLEDLARTLPDELRGRAGV